MSIRNLFLLLPLVLTGCPQPPQPPTGTVKPVVAIDVPDFRFTERNGQQISLADLKGKVWIASFVFTRCTGPCPQVTATMKRLQDELQVAQHANLRLVTFTVDPDRDTPNELKDYAKRYEAHPERWLFLTGKEETMHDLLKEGFKVTAQRSKSPTPGDEFDHSSRLVVVDKNGTIRNYYDGMQSKNVSKKDFDDNLEQLRAQVLELLAE